MTDVPLDPKPTVTNAHVAGVSDIFDIMALPGRWAADLMNSGTEMWRTNVSALLAMANPKLLEGTRAGHIYAIAKHYLPAAVLNQFPLVIQQGMAAMGITSAMLKEMEEDDLTIFILEAAGRWQAQFERGTLNKPEYNKKFLAEDKDGVIGEMDPDAIIALFRGKNSEDPEPYPRIVFTASHANAESVDDVTRITHGIEAMARDSWGGDTLNLAHRGEDITPGQTLILFGNDTRSNAMLNGAALTRRVKELKEREADGKPDTFQYMAPGAKRLARLMLACMCENYYKDGAKLFDINDLQPLSEIFADKNDRIHLSSDARRIAQHFQLLGYSKGGNVVSDAMRFLERDLMSVDAQDHGIVRTSSTDKEDRGILRLEKYGVRSLLRNINTASIAARERPFTEEQKAHGLRRVAFNNIHDLLTNNYFYKSSPNDEFYEIEGTEDKVGHDPEDAMGNRQRRGYVLDDERVARRMKEFFAPHYSKAAIANLFIEEGKLKMESAPGTPDYTMRKNEAVILAALTRAGLTNPRLVGNPYHIGVIDIEADEDFTKDAAALRKVGKAFQDLRKSAEGLLIAEKIIKRDVPHLTGKITGRGR